jgi:hypothetical protein
MTPDVAIGSVLLRALSELEGSIVRPLDLQFRSVTFEATIVLTPRAGNAQETATSRRVIDQCILEAIGDRTLFAKEIAKEAGYSDSRHFRDSLRRLESEGEIEKTPAGYRVCGQPQKTPRLEDDSSAEATPREAKLAEHLANSNQRSVPNIEECILEAIGDLTLYAKQVASRSGYSYSSHLRETLSRMVSEGKLSRTLDGYAATGRASKQPPGNCCSPAEAAPCVECTPGGRGRKSILDWQQPAKLAQP